jgi:hypothetical protein
VGAGGALHVRRGPTDDRAHPDQGRSLGLVDPPLDSDSEFVESVDVIDDKRMPAVCVKPLADVLGESLLGRAVQLDVVVVVEVDEAAEA